MVSIRAPTVPIRPGSTGIPAGVPAHSTPLSPLCLPASVPAGRRTTIRPTGERGQLLRISSFDAHTFITNTTILQTMEGGFETRLPAYCHMKMEREPCPRKVKVSQCNWLGERGKAPPSSKVITSRFSLTAISLIYYLKHLELTAPQFLLFGGKSPQLDTMCLTDIKECEVT